MSCFFPDGYVVDMETVALYYAAKKEQEYEEDKNRNPKDYHPNHPDA
jgi:hypothetical protein